MGSSKDARVLSNDFQDFDNDDESESFAVDKGSICAKIAPNSHAIFIPGIKYNTHPINRILKHTPSVTTIIAVFF